MKVPALASAIALALTVSATAQDRTNSLVNGVAPMATTDPQILIYRVSGVLDNGSPDLGVATTFACSSISSQMEIVRIRLFNYDGVLMGDRTLNISPKRTVSISTHSTMMISEDSVVSPGTAINRGMAGIIATSKEIFCSAMIVDAVAAIPNGVALHMVRFNPAQGSVE